MRIIRLGLLAIVGLACVARAEASTIAFDNSIVDVVPGFTAFMTGGAQMDGLSVTAYFADGSETRSWQDTGLTSGGVTGTTWSLSVAAVTTYTSLGWIYTTTDPERELTRLVLDGSAAFTVFDLLFNSTDANPFGDEGTAGSNVGLTFRTNSDPETPLPHTDFTVVATYRQPVKLSSNAGAPLFDAYHVLDINFSGLAAGGITDFSFTQDTDNDSRFVDVNTTVPEPASLLLVGTGLAAAAARRRRRR